MGLCWVQRQQRKKHIFFFLSLSVLILEGERNLNLVSIVIIIMYGTREREIGGHKGGMLIVSEWEGFIKKETPEVDM